MSTEQSSHSAVPASTLGRASLVVGLFRDRPQLTLTEVSRGTSIPRTSALRMLDHLVRIGWLRRCGTEYELGDSLAELGALALYRNKFDLVVAPLLRELHRITGHVVHLGVLQGNEVHYLEKIGAPPTWIGERVPAQSSTIGKALLGAARRPPAANGTGPGSEVTFANCVTGVSCIGVHVGTLGGAAVGLSVSGQVRFDQWHAAPVRMAASAIARYLDSPQPSGAGRTVDPRNGRNRRPWDLAAVTWD